MSKKTLVCCLVLALALALTGTAMADHSWNNYHWARTSNPLPLQVVDSVSPDWQFELETALSEWSQSSKLDLTITSGDDATRTRKQCKMVSGQMRVCNAAYGNNGWLGLASIGLDNQGHIDQGTAKMNDSYSSYWTDPNEKRHVMCQEVGHVFGLGHTSEDGSSQGTCMDYSQSPSSISPNQHDYQLLDTIYSHLDSYNSYAEAGGGGGGGICHGNPHNCFGNVPDGVPAGAVPVNRGLHSETWVMPRAGGGLWIFHVRLAEH